MAKQDYLPKPLGELRLWLVNYRAKLITYKGTLVITDTDFNNRITFIDNLIAALDANTEAQQVAQGKRQALDVQTVTSGKGIRAGAQLDKKSSAYTTNIGEQMGIIGDEQTIDIPASQPKMKATKSETGYVLSFSLNNFFDAVKIFRQRPGESKVFIAIDTSSPYLDTEAMVNGTKYTAFFMIGDNSVGLESDAVVISI